MTRGPVNGLLTGMHAPTPLARYTRGRRIARWFTDLLNETLTGTRQYALL
jgi:hypothetical protein